METINFTENKGPRLLYWVSAARERRPGVPKPGPERALGLRHGRSGRRPARGQARRPLEEASGAPAGVLELTPGAGFRSWLRRPGRPRGRWGRGEQAAGGGRLPGCGSGSGSSGCAAVHDPRPCLGPGRSLGLGFSPPPSGWWWQVRGGTGRVVAKTEGLGARNG